MLEYFDLEYAINRDGEVAMTDFAKYIEFGSVTRRIKRFDYSSCRNHNSGQWTRTDIGFKCCTISKTTFIILILTSIRGTGHLFIFKLKGVVLSDALTAHITELKEKNTA